MADYILESSAERDLWEILTYIATDSPENAFRVEQRFEEIFELLAGNPGIGHLRSDLTSRPVRFFPVYAYLVVYLPDWQPIEIVRILGGTRDIQHILK